MLRQPDSWPLDGSVGQLGTVPHEKATTPQRLETFHRNDLAVLSAFLRSSLDAANASSKVVQQHLALLAHECLVEGDCHLRRHRRGLLDYLSRVR